MKTTNPTKTMRSIALLFICIMMPALSFAQAKKLAVFNCDIRGFAFNKEQATGMLQMEIEKQNKFNVIDRYEIENAKAVNSTINWDNCFHSSCLVEAGKTVKADVVLTGSIEMYSDYYNISLRIIDVATGEIISKHTKAYINVSSKLQTMVGIALTEMLKGEKDALSTASLNYKPQVENAMNNPGVKHLNLGGPRFGVVSFLGESAKILTDNKAKGGFDMAYPVMTQFGYQFEKMYLNDGNMQGLFEFIPMISGLDHGKIIPSFTIMHGLRSNLSGWEFAVGPTFSFATLASGFYDEFGNWNLEKDYKGQGSNPFEIEKRLDSRGNATLIPSVAFAVGKSFRSGNFNVPVNMFVVPSKYGVKAGVSVGFNTKK